MIVQLVVAAGNRKGQVIPVSAEKFIIGRADDCHLKPRSELISRYHCAILVGNDVVVRDLGSRNGVRLNGEKISAEQKLKNGDELVVGPLEFYVHITDSGTLAECSTDEPVNMDISWFRRTETNTKESEEQLFSSTILLNHLKSLNEATKTESDHEEQPPNPMKKFLS